MTTDIGRSRDDSVVGSVMSQPPPPTGRPTVASSRPDPWKEQAIRHARHRAEHKRRRRRLLVPLLVLTVLAVIAFAGSLARDAWVERREADPATSVEPPPSTNVGAGDPEPAVPAEQLIEIDQVWLVDRGDGVYDWGVSVRTPEIAPTRSGVVIDVRLIDAADAVVEEASGVVDGIGPESIGAVTGRLNDAEQVPVRLEFDVAVGVESGDRALDDLLSVRALERTPGSVRGRIRSEVASPIDDVTMVLLWLGDDGEVVAAVPQPVEQVRPAVDARFDIDLDDEVVPDGRPDSVVWTS